MSFITFWGAKLTPCAPMADPLNSGDDVSSSGKLEASEPSHTDFLPISDL